MANSCPGVPDGLKALPIVRRLSILDVKNLHAPSRARCDGSDGCRAVRPLLGAEQTCHKDHLSEAIDVGRYFGGLLGRDQVDNPLMAGPTHHDPIEVVAGDDWLIAGTLLDLDGDPLDLTDAVIEWALLSSTTGSHKVLDPDLDTTDALVNTNHKGLPMIGIAEFHAPRTHGLARMYATDAERELDCRPCVVHLRHWQ
jgi:hypothetical protein